MDQGPIVLGCVYLANTYVVSVARVYSRSSKDLSFTMRHVKDVQVFCLRLNGQSLPQSCCSQQ